MKQTYRSPNPALNVARRPEAVASDTIIASDTPAIGCGCKFAQLFIGTQSLVADVSGVKSDAEFASTLLDNIKLRGAMDVLITDSAPLETSHLVQEILRMYIIEAKQSEAY